MDALAELPQAQRRLVAAVGVAAHVAHEAQRREDAVHVALLQAGRQRQLGDAHGPPQLDQALQHAEVLHHRLVDARGHVRVAGLAFAHGAHASASMTPHSPPALPKARRRPPGCQAIDVIAVRPPSRSGRADVAGIVGRGELHRAVVVADGEEPRPGPPGDRGDDALRARRQLDRVAGHRPVVAVERPDDRCRGAGGGEERAVRRPCPAVHPALVAEHAEMLAIGEAPAVQEAVLRGDHQEPAVGRERRRRVDVIP